MTTNREIIEKKSQLQKLRTKIILAESLRASGEPAVTLEEAKKRLAEKYTTKA